MVCPRPFLVIRNLTLIADYSSLCPKGLAALKVDMFEDDLFTGAQAIEELLSFVILNIVKRILISYHNNVNTA